MTKWNQQVKAQFYSGCIFFFCCCCCRKSEKRRRGREVELGFPARRTCRRGIEKCICGGRLITAAILWLFVCFNIFSFFLYSCSFFFVCVFYSFLVVCLFFSLTRLFRSMLYAFFQVGVVIFTSLTVDIHRHAFVSCQ